MVTRRDYNAIAVEAARSVLIELVHLLGEYRDDVVLVGGWVPELLLSSSEKPHVGSIDVDLALNHRNLQEEAYRRIQKLLLSRGYEQGEQPYIFRRRVQVNGREVTVEVDLLAGEYGGTGKGRRHQRIQGQTLARKARGCDLAFEIEAKEVTIEGDLPEGGKDSVTVRVASEVPFFVMKGMALEGRLKEKDAWDIYYVLLTFRGGLDGLVTEFKPYIGHGLVQEGLEKIAKAFSSWDHVGPRSVVAFEEIGDLDERERVQRDAYERVSYLLQQLGVK